jgi:hypothetical protein
MGKSVSKKNIKKSPHRPLTEKEKPAYLAECGYDEDVGEIQLWLDEQGNRDADLYDEWREEAISTILEACWVGDSPKSPDKLKEEIAIRLGRTPAGLNNYVSEWQGKYGKDLPWVIRKNGLPWLPDMERFEKWLKSTEGNKAIKKKRGRPRKGAH